MTGGVAMPTWEGGGRGRKGKEKRRKEGEKSGRGSEVTRGREAREGGRERNTLPECHGRHR